MTKRKIERDARALIRAELPGLRYAESYEDSQGMLMRSVYLGSVVSIMPSGKYYTPVACSNVGPCPRCKGKGCDFCGELGSREAYEDELFNEAMDREADKQGCFVFAGEGDPTDLFLGEGMGEPETEEETDDDRLHRCV